MKESDKDNSNKEIQSLTGRIDKSAMGQRDERQKPKKSVKNVSEKKNTNITFKKGDIFE